MYTVNIILIDINSPYSKHQNGPLPTYPPWRSAGLPRAPPLPPS